MVLVLVEHLRGNHCRTCQDPPPPSSAAALAAALFLAFFCFFNSLDWALSLAFSFLTFSFFSAGESLEESLSESLEESLAVDRSEDSEDELELVSLVSDCFAFEVCFTLLRFEEVTCFLQGFFWSLEVSVVLIFVIADRSAAGSVFLVSVRTGVFWSILWRC